MELYDGDGIIPYHGHGIIPYHGNGIISGSGTCASPRLIYSLHHNIPEFIGVQPTKPSLHTVIYFSNYD